MKTKQFIIPILFLLASFISVGSGYGNEPKKKENSDSFKQAFSSTDPIYLYDDFWLAWNDQINTMKRHLVEYLQEVEQSQAYDFTPRTELVHEGEQFIVRLDLPGVEKEDITVEIENGYLKVQGERKNQWGSEEKKGNVHYYKGSVHYGKFIRTIQLPEEVDSETVEASFKNGVLTIRLSLKGETEPNKISVPIQ